jgi:hypothetical protein
MRYIELDAASTERTLQEWLSAKPTGGVFALLPEAEKAQLPLLQSMCRNHGIALLGAIFPALVRQQKFVTQGAWLLRFAAMPPHFLLADINAGKPSGVERVVAEVRTAVRGQPAGTPKPTLFMIFDGMVPNIASLLDGIYIELSNRVDYAGVNAGSESFQPMPCLFDENRVLGDGVLGLLLPGNTATVLEHGFVCPERAMSATTTEGNRIAMIDWRPAFTVYQEIIKAEYGIDLTPENFYQHAVHFPFGILRASGDVVVRIPVALTEDGSLYCVGEIPENSVLVLLKAPEAGGNGCIGRLINKLQNENGLQHGQNLLSFYCAGRRMHLGAAAESELAALYAGTGAAEMAGALSLGEIGSTVRWGYPMFHNATLVCMPWLAR